MKSIYICDYGYSKDWIMGKIARDIMESAIELGYSCRCGGVNEYNNEDICYHLNFHIAVPFPQAKHNSVFYTHLNDLLQEINIEMIKGLFDSYICMSKEDAQFLIELGFDKAKVFGHALPIRNDYVRPLNLGIFSACYQDGRKNEQWLVDYCYANPNINLVNFIFIGEGWGKILADLEKAGTSFEWHRVQKDMPYEYKFQQSKLANLDFYFYMGMDGGAMGTYDAYAMGLPLCITYDGYHKDIPNVSYVFDNKESFYEQLDDIISKQANRINFFKSNTITCYVNWIISVWENQVDTTYLGKDVRCISYATVIDKKRDQYYNLSLKRLRKFISVQLQKYKIRKQIKQRGSTHHQI